MTSEDGQIMWVEEDTGTQKGDKGKEKRIKEFRNIREE